MTHMDWQRIVLFTLVTCVLSACGQSDNQSLTPTSADSVVIRGAGATFPEPLYQRWFEELEKNTPTINWEYQGVGSGAGVKQFIAGEVDFGASDAAMKDSEIAQIDGGTTLLPVTAGMVVLAYNLPDVDETLRLPRDVYVDIFLGKVYRWDDSRILAANPGVDIPPRLIQVIGRRDSSGTTFAFTNHLGAVSEEWRDGPGVGKLIDWPGGAMVGSGNTGVAQKIKITNNSIGYVEYGFAKRLGLSVATIENKAGQFVAPTADSGQQALGSATDTETTDLRVFVPDPDGESSYPIVTYSWLLLYENYSDLSKRNAIKDALNWSLDEGQDIARELGYIPIPDNMKQLARAAVDEIK